MSEQFTEWQFVTDANQNECPGISYPCEPPHACAFDPGTKRHYCCQALKNGNCWNKGDTGEDVEFTKACAKDQDLAG